MACILTFTQTAQSLNQATGCPNAPLRPFISSSESDKVRLSSFAELVWQYQIGDVDADDPAALLGAFKWLPTEMQMAMVYDGQSFIYCGTDADYRQRAIVSFTPTKMIADSFAKRKENGSVLCGSETASAQAAISSMRLRNLLRDSGVDRLIRADENEIIFLYP